MKNAYLLAGVVAVVLSGARLSAHHSHASTYYEDRKVTIEGNIVQVSIRNPHSWVHIDVKGPKGEVITYAVEWAAGAQLNRTGIAGKTLKAGDHVTITGAPGRNEADHRLEMLVLRRPSDGFSWGTLPGEVVN